MAFRNPPLRKRGRAKAGVAAEGRDEAVDIGSKDEAVAGALDRVPFWMQKTTWVTETSGNDGQVCGDGGGMPGGESRGARNRT